MTKGFTTKAIHGVPLKRDVHGSLRMPVYDNVAFEFERSRDLELAFEGKKPAHAYSRITNPTVEDFEQRIRLLADASTAVAFSSGMAAIVNAIMALAESGANIVTTHFLFGNTLSLFTHTLADWGLETRLVDMNDIQKVESAIDEKTRAVFFEVMTNPQLEVADVEQVAQVAHRHNVPIVVDSTILTPYLFQSKRFGVDLEVLSSTKYISGGGTSVGGVLIDNGIFDWRNCAKLRKDARRYGPFALIMTVRRELSRNLGTCMSPHSAYLQTLGLETLALRADRSCDNAMAIAMFLAEHPKIHAINYPGMKASRFHELAKKQFNNRFGALLTFELQSKEQCFTFMDALTVIRRATNLNDNKTLIIHPSSTIFCEYSDEQKEQMRVNENMIRLAAGIEDVDDLIDDIKKGLNLI